MRQITILEEIQQFYSKSQLEEHDKHFIRDGVINQELFNSQKKRILFIAKEHNVIGSGEYLDRPDDGYSEWWNQHVHLQFSHRISEWAYGILNDFPPFLPGFSKELKHNALRSIAFINVKKSGGTAVANPKVIFKYIDQTKPLLIKQIKDIDPTHIITCFRLDSFAERLFDIALQRPSSGTFGHGSWQGIKVINFYHPSSRKRKQFLYEQLAESFK